jgi:hypothetical protein
MNPFKKIWQRMFPDKKPVKSLPTKSERILIRNRLALQKKKKRGAIGLAQQNEFNE